MVNYQFKMIKLEENEKIIAEVRKHWFIFLLESIGSILAIITPIIILIISIPFIEISVSENTFLISVFFYLIWIIIVWIYFFLSWTDYYLDVWIITNRKIIDIEQKGLFNRETSSFRLDHIQDITIDVSGIIATLIGYGDIYVQTAGENRSFSLKFVANPTEVKEIILKEYNREILDRQNNSNFPRP